MAAPAHRSVSNIRPSVVGSHSPASGSPHTPVRAISSTFGSPSTLRAEEDCIVVEFGTRYLRIGFAGDSLPKAVIELGPELQKRAGDYGKWELDYDTRWRDRVTARKWGEIHELWQLDLRSVNLGLVGDKIEKALREAFIKYLLIDSRPRRMALIFPSALPLPLLSTTVNTLFLKFQPPTISLISAPVASTVSAGLRSALVIDIGWAETIVTGVYEFREVSSRRTIRGSKSISQEILKLLGRVIISQKSANEEPEHQKETAYENLLSFEECEDITNRMSWCKASRAKVIPQPIGGLEPVREEEDPDSVVTTNTDYEALIRIPLHSTQPPMTIELPFSSFAKPCETALFADGVDLHDLDDEELPLHHLVYRTLMYLPVDIRSICMSRILFTGGASNMPGLRERVMDEVDFLVQRFKWDPVQGKAVELLKSKSKTHSNRAKQANDGPDQVPAEVHANGPSNLSFQSAGFESQETDPIEEHLRREARKANLPPVYGQLRSVDSLGAWSGASILSQLKIPIVSLIEREQWLQHGAAGASKYGEANITKQRQSMGAAGLRTATTEQTSWTLGIWG